MKILVLPGDGIGPEIMTATMTAVAALTDGGRPAVPIRVGCTNCVAGVLDHRKAVFGG